MAAKKNIQQVIIAPTDSYYEQLHNDYQYPLEIDGKRYKSPTHFIYSSMMPNKQLADFITYQIDGKTVRNKANGILFGKKVKGDRKLAQASEIIMMKALEEGYRAAFNQPLLRDKLLGMDNESIVYIRNTHTFLPGDVTVLGINESKNGQNKLGLLLERIREDIMKNIKARNKPPQELHEIDRLFFAIIRRQLLLKKLRAGHFPTDYTLKGLYMQSKNISEENFNSSFMDEYPASLRISYWNIYKRGIENKKHTLDPEVIQEFKTGNDEWVGDAYDKAIKEKCILIEILKYLGIDYDTLLISLAKQKILEAYSGRKFENRKDTIVQLSMEEYLNKYKITFDTLIYIGEEALTDLRENIFYKYTKGKFSGIPDFEEKLASSIEGLRGIISQSITYPKFIPNIENPSEKFLNLIALDVPLEPESPRRTYGGISTEDYYSFVNPDGACGDSVTELCPLAAPHPSFTPVQPRGSKSDDEGSDNDSDSGDENDEYKEDSDDDKGSDKGDIDGYEMNNSDDEEDQGDQNDDEYGVFGDDQNIDEAIEKNKKIPGIQIKKYIKPIVSVLFSDETYYPYEFLSPYYISNIRVKGVYYPSVAHYVAAKLATPFQLRNISPRIWIQKNQDSTVYEKDPYTLPKYFYTIKETIEALPDRIQKIYNTLYVQYASRALNTKFKGYPFRQILFETGNKKILYKDENNMNAIAGNELVKILTDIRNDIDNVQILKPLPNPVYKEDKNKALTLYIRERTRELLKGIVLFARYRMSPRYRHANVNNVPIIGFDDARFILQKMYVSCRDVDYNEYVKDPPDNYKEDFEEEFRTLSELYFPGRTIYDIRNPDVQDAIQMKMKGKSEDTFEDKLFISFDEIMKLVWVHIVYVCILLEEELPENYSQDQLKQRIKDMRKSIFKTEMGTKKDIVVTACINILTQLHLFFPDQTFLEDSDICFIKDFIYPLDTIGPTSILSESESYNTYPMLLEKVTEIYSNTEQNLQSIKKLASVLDGIIGVDEKEEKILFNKITIRLKFFATQVE